VMAAAWEMRVLILAGTILNLGLFA
jgi:hypothetical protein